MLPFGVIFNNNFVVVVVVEFDAILATVDCILRYVIYYTNRIGTKKNKICFKVPV